MFVWPYGASSTFVPYSDLASRSLPCTTSAATGVPSVVLPQSLGLEQVRQFLVLRNAEQKAEFDAYTDRLIEQLATTEPDQDADKIRSKWLYLVLIWIFEHRESYPDPLQTVEEVYADFGYPERIADFVRYMPMNEPDLVSRELNEQRLYEKWKRYVDEEAAKYVSPR